MWKKCRANIWWKGLLVLDTHCNPESYTQTKGLWGKRVCSVYSVSPESSAISGDACYSTLPILANLLLEYSIKPFSRLPEKKIKPIKKVLLLSTISRDRRTCCDPHGSHWWGLLSLELLLQAGISRWQCINTQVPAGCQQKEAQLTCHLLGGWSHTSYYQRGNEGFLCGLS